MERLSTGRDQPGVESQVMIASSLTQALSLARAYAYAHAQAPVYAHT